MVVGHPFLLAYNQKKYVAMKRLDPGLHLRLLVPDRWCERFDWRACEIHPGLSPQEVTPLHSWPRGWHMTYLHNPVRVAAALRDFQPDVIHIEEEPQALITVETIILRNAFAPRAALSAFTWDNLLRRRRLPLGALKRGLRRFSLRHLSAMSCGNRRASELLRAEALFAGEIAILPQHGLDEAEHHPGRELPLRSRLGLEGVPVIGYLGRMVPEKGLRLLFNALSTLQEYSWKLLLVGSGPLEEEIRQRWMAELPGRIVLLPPVPYDQVAQYLRCTDVFALPSYSSPTWSEQFGLTLAQAMMLGIACIGSSAGAIPDVLGPGGLGFAESSASGLARALQSLIRSPGQRKLFGDRGRHFALANYTAETVAGKYLAFFEQARRSHIPRSRVPQTRAPRTQVPQSEKTQRAFAVSPSPESAHATKVYSSKS